MTDNVWDGVFDNPLPETPELEIDTLNLLNVGKLQDEIDVFGNKIIIRTLTIGELLQVGLLSKRYKDSDSEHEAIVTAIVASCVVSINGEPIFGSLGPNDTSLERKFNYLQSNYYWVVIRAIYEKYLDLITRVEESIEELKKNS